MWFWRPIKEVWNPQGWQSRREDYCCSFTKSYATLCNPMNFNTPGLSVIHNLLEFAQTHIHSTWQGCCLINIIVTGQWHFCSAGFVPVYQAVGELGQWNNPKQVSPGCSGLLASLWQLLSLLCISLPPWNAGGDTTYGEDQSWHSECPHNWGPSQSEWWPCQRQVVLEKTKPPLQPSSPDDPTLLALLVPITSALSWCLYPQVQRSITQHHQKVEAIQGFIDGWMDKQNVVHPFNGILFNHKRKKIPTGCNVNEP